MKKKSETAWSVRLDSTDKNLIVREATEDEIKRVLTTRQVELPEPIELASEPPENKFKRANPASVYFENTQANNDPILNDDEKMLEAIFNSAIKRGWKGWREYVQDSITLGAEAYNMVKVLKNHREYSVREILLRDDLARCLFGVNYQANLKEAQQSVSMLKYIYSEMIHEAS